MIKSLLVFIVTTSLLLVQPSWAFITPPQQQHSATITTQRMMGWFDGISKAFANDEYGPPPDKVSATARHILVKSENKAKDIKKQLQTGSSEFASLAQEYSTCPSGKKGGSLGSFSPGTMVPAFDKAIFSPDAKVGEIIGPIETEFGYHLILVDKRTGGGDWY
eukprot:CAMPEP_0194135652 /NCGR_PEP_ID=MMETSP0152-20130528/5755_1 /TAXON_ID=1049557 /ORGANISM="Thalassiothrix antarctica, Strain L6-D1" /LENGTH=162 /DNA_ID=CAMNT_0038831991 /DNA_START=108 /DNA_END=596 /DNA_ORIENTATION=-